MDYRTNSPLLLRYLANTRIFENLAVTLNSGRRLQNRSQLLPIINSKQDNLKYLGIMIKRIVVALDPDEDTKTAIKYAIRLSRRFDATLTGLAVVDIGNVHAVIGVGGYGSDVYAMDSVEDLTGDTEKVADELLKAFVNSAERENLRHDQIKEQGAAAERIIGQMKYHDLLIAGRDTHFFYNEPDKNTDTLAQVVKNGVSPVLVATDLYEEVEKVLIAFDGSAAAARSLKSFVHLLPYGKDVEIDLVGIIESKAREEDQAKSESLDQAERYLRIHNFNYINKLKRQGEKPGTVLLQMQEEMEPNLVVLGAHAVSAIRRATFGSTTHDLITATRKPLFLSP